MPAATHSPAAPASLHDVLPTVLVVDDEVRSQDALRRTLDEDFTVFTASNADEARGLRLPRFFHIPVTRADHPG